MRFFAVALVLVLVAVFALGVLAEPAPEPAQGPRVSFPRSRASGIAKGKRGNSDSLKNDGSLAIIADADADANDEANMDTNADVVGDDDDDKNDGNATKNKKTDPSSGRLFFNKLLLFRNAFAQQRQPIIPIIITSGAGTAPLTYSSPSLTSPITTGNTSPALSPTTGTSPAVSPVASPVAGRGDILKDEEDQPTDGAPAAAAATVVDDKEIAAALAAGAQEYVVTDQEIRGTSDAKANRAPAQINLRRPGTRRGQGQTISVRIPARYRKYFRNGQRVMLNTRNRQVNRRVAQRRRNNNRNRRRNATGNRRRRVNN